MTANTEGSVRGASEIEIFAWNPVRPAYKGKLTKHLPVRRPLNNFGDLLGPMIVAGMRARCGLTGAARRSGQLLSVGSVLHFAQDGAVVWGTGRNGKIEAERHRAERLDIRAVRGPRTRAFLRDRGFDVPAVYGDPALLLPVLRPDLRSIDRTMPLTVVPNFNDAPSRARDGWLDPRSPLEQCLQTIARSELVVGSSLHGVIVAEALGIPARLVLPQRENIFKYRDYYEATGRPDFRPARTVDEAAGAGGEPAPTWDPDPLLTAFPTDLWAPA